MKNYLSHKVWLFKSKFYTLNYKINNKIYKFNYLWHLNHKEMNVFSLNGGSKNSIYDKNIYLF